jgi:hypothetical protein
MIYLVYVEPVCCYYYSKAFLRMVIVAMDLWYHNTESTISLCLCLTTTKDGYFDIIVSLTPTKDGSKNYFANWSMFLYIFPIYS